LLESSVETVTEFIQISLKVFVTDSVIGAPYEGFCIPDKDVDPGQLFFHFMGFHYFSLVLKMFGKYSIGRIIIRSDCRLIPNGRGNDIPNGIAIKRFHDGHFRVSRGRAPILHGDDHLRFVSRAATAFPGDGAAEKRFVHFYNMAEHISGVPIFHCFPDFMDHQPGGDIIDGQQRFQPFCGTSPFVRADQIDGPKPFSQRNAGPMKQRLCGYCGLMMTGFALKHFPFRGKIRFSMPAFRTDKPIRPAEFLKVLKTLFFRLKPLLKLEEIDFSIRTHAYPHFLSVISYMGVNIYILSPFVKHYVLTT